MRKELYYGIVECADNNLYILGILQVIIMRNLPQYQPIKRDSLSLPNYSAPDTVKAWYKTNMQSLLSAALKDAILKGELGDAKYYANRLFVEGGVNTPKGYGAALGFNTRNPLGGNYKWNMKLKIPLKF